MLYCHLNKVSGVKPHAQPHSSQQGIHPSIHSSNLLSSSLNLYSIFVKVIRIFSHLPLILDQLRNEALRERKAIKEASGGIRRIILSDSLRWPWISLIEKDDDVKTPIPFKVEDNRLVDPARTLARLHLSGIREFTTLGNLTDEARKEVGGPAVTLAVNPRRQGTNQMQQ